MISIKVYNCLKFKTIAVFCLVHYFFLMIINHMEFRISISNNWSYSNTRQNMDIDMNMSQVLIHRFLRYHLFVQIR